MNTTTLVIDGIEIEAYQVDVKAEPSQLTEMDIKVLGEVHVNGQRFPALVTIKARVFVNGHEQELEVEDLLNWVFGGAPVNVEVERTITIKRLNSITVGTSNGTLLMRGGKARRYLEALASRSYRIDLDSGSGQFYHVDALNNRQVTRVGWNA